MVCVHMYICVEMHTGQHKDLYRMMSIPAPIKKDTLSLHDALPI